MKALFITTATIDCANHAKAFGLVGEVVHFTFEHKAIRNDWSFVQEAEKHRPDVIFYIGANEAMGNPRVQTLYDLRQIAPSILLCSDAADTPWHPTLERYRRHQSFDLMVSIDGANKAPVDLATLTPVHYPTFDSINVKRDIRLGFSGTVGRWNSRSEIIKALQWFGGLTVRNRQENGYEDHVSFLKRCSMLLNISLTGSQQFHHIKGRVLEAGWAGCALLEPESSPIGEWFPRDCYFTYGHPQEVAQIVRDAPDTDIARAASRLSEEVRRRFRPEMIYGEMLNRVGVTESRPAA